MIAFYPFNLHNSLLVQAFSRSVRADRDTALGNPFVMTETHSRDQVCAGYEKYFQLILSGSEPEDAAYEVAEEQQLLIGKFWKNPNRKAFVRALNDIFEAALKDYQQRGIHTVFLQCWCAPQKCHVDTICSYFNTKIEGMLEKIKPFDYSDPR